MFNADSELFYWGCWGRVGHALWTRHGTSVTPSKVLPDNIAKQIDSGFAPNPSGGKTPLTRGPQVEGAANLVHLDGWTVLAFWDRSIDSRQGSNSVLVVKATISFSEMLMLGPSYFSTVWSRFDFTITLYAPHASLPHEAKIADLEARLKRAEQTARVYYDLLTSPGATAAGAKTLILEAAARVRDLEAKLAVVDDLIITLRDFTAALRGDKS